MRKVSIINLKEAQILAHPVLDAKGRVLLSAGVKLTQSYIRKMNEVGVDSVLIEDSRLDGVLVDVVISSKTKVAAYQSANIIRKQIESNKPVSAENMKELIRSMIHDVLSVKGVLGYVSDFKGYDGFIFHHSVNTAILALIIGAAAGYSEDRLLELGVGSFVHDIGKIQIPGTIINKTHKLSTEEFDIIKEHPRTGYELLRKTKDVSLIAAHISLQHHERWDGSGYPRHLKGTKIHEYARVAAIADVYEALTSNRVYRNAIEPYEAHEYITAHSGLLFDPSLIEIFSKHVTIYPNGSGVILSNGMRGNVLKQTAHFPSRPCVRMLYDGSEPLSSPIDYDLCENKSLMITGVENY